MSGSVLSIKSEWSKLRGGEGGGVCISLIGKWSKYFDILYWNPFSIYYIYISIYYFSILYIYINILFKYIISTYYYYWNILTCVAALPWWRPSGLPSCSSARPPFALQPLRISFVKIFGNVAPLVNNVIHNWMWHNYWTNNMDSFKKIVISTICALLPLRISWLCMKIFGTITL